MEEYLINTPLAYINNRCIFTNLEKHFLGELAEKEDRDTSCNYIGVDGSYLLSLARAQVHFIQDKWGQVVGTFSQC